MAERRLTVALEQDGPIPLAVAFDCAPGAVLGIFGPSGSGKTTILRSIAGLYAPRTASIAIGGEVWVDTASGRFVPPHRRPVGMVFQEYALFPHMTALGNVMTAIGVRPRGERRERAEHLLERVHLAGRRHRRPAELSGGERQRVALARALAREPAVLLLDEPFSAVDRAVRRRLQDEIDDLRRSFDVPLVLVTHDFDDIIRLASHLLVLEHGRAVASGPLGDLTSRPDSGWLGEAVGPGAVLEAVVARVDRAGGLADLAFEGGTLVSGDTGLSKGMPVRVRVPARDVVLAGREPSNVSLHNVLAATVVALAPEPVRGHVIVQLAVGRERLLAEVTRDAIARLHIEPGRDLFALVKSVSLEVLPLRTRHSL